MTAERFCVLAASAADAERLADIRVEAMRPSLEAAGRFDPERARNRFLDTFVPADTKIIRLNGAVAGFFVARALSGHLYLDHLYLIPACQNRGIGRRIVEDLKAEARSAALPLRLTALNDSPASRFYRSCGFRAVSADAVDTIFEWSP